MIKQIDSPFSEGAKVNLRERKYRLWHNDTWVEGNYLGYECEATGEEHRTEEIKQVNQERAKEYFEKRIKPRVYE